MKKSFSFHVVCICVMLSLMTLFTSVGYAALSGKLAISGTAQWNEAARVYIKNVTIDGNRTITKAGFLAAQHGNYQINRQGTVTITFTVRNNSGRDQYFKEFTTDPALPTQGCTITYSSNFPKGTLLRNGADPVTFTITIKNTSTTSINMKDRVSMLVFTPEFTAGDTENATEGLAGSFENILSGLGPNGDGEGIVYKGKTIPADQIVKTLQDNMIVVDTGGYIANVGNASKDQKDLITAIFGDNIVMELGNNTYTVSVLIKNQQIDGKDDNDMVMYITADQLTKGGGTWRNNAWQNLNNVPVYAIVFIKDKQSGEYLYCDHLFVGEAPVCDINGNMGDGKVGNFNTNLWNSTEYPNLTNTSGGSISQNGITTNGELDEAYQEFMKTSN